MGWFVSILLLTTALAGLLIKVGELRGWPKRRRILTAIVTESIGVLIAILGFWPSEPTATLSQ